MNKIIFISLLTSISLINASEHKLEKIDPDSVFADTSTTKNALKEDKVVHKKLKLINYKNITYNKYLLPYSYIKPNKELYKKFLKKNNITNPLILNNLFGRVFNSLAVKVSAFGYDWVLHKPNYAQNFYLYWIKNFELSPSDRFYIADYLLRTNQLEKMTFITKGYCMSFFKKKLRGKCKYYYGLKKYLETGKINGALKSAAEYGIEEAKKIIRGE